MVDNSRIGIFDGKRGKRTAPEDLIDKKGFFKVPEKAAGKTQSRNVVPALYRPCETYVGSAPQNSSLTSSRNMK